MNASLASIRNRAPFSEFRDARRLFDIVAVCLMPLILIISFWDESSTVDGWPPPEDSFAPEFEWTVESPGGFFGATVLNSKLQSHFRQFSEMGLGNFEVVVVEEIESFREESDYKLLEWLSVGKTVTKVEAPVTFRFHVSFNEKWRIIDDGEKVIVYCPEIQPSLPAAVHIDKMKVFAEDAILRFDKKDQLEQTRMKFFPIVNDRARKMSKDKKVKDRARESIEKFAQTFFSGGRPVDVVFPSDLEGSFASPKR